MEIRNGIHVYGPDEQPPTPEGLSADFKVTSPYGFKVVEVKGEKMWAVATEEDYRNVAAQLRGISPDEVSITKGCYQSDPYTCVGECGGLGFCRLVYQPANHYYTCQCV